MMVSLKGVPARVSVLVSVLVLVLVVALGQSDPVEDQEDELLELDTDEDLDLPFYDSFDYDDMDQEMDALEETVVMPKETPQSNMSPDSTSLDLDLFGPDTGLGMPTCLLCTCLGGSVYCDDSDLEDVPPLPKDTTHFYARFNKIEQIKNTTFMNLNMLRSIDLTGNDISEIDEAAFRLLPLLQKLVLADNDVKMLPQLPTTMRFIDLRNNRLKSSAMHPGFQDMSGLEYLYLSDNDLDHVPTPLPLGLRVLHLQNNNIQSLLVDTFCDSHDPTFIRPKLEDIRLDGNPLNTHLFGAAYSCLPRLPVGTR